MIGLTINDSRFTINYKPDQAETATPRWDNKLGDHINEETFFSNLIGSPALYLFARECQRCEQSRSERKTSTANLGNLRNGEAPHCRTCGR